MHSAECMVVKNMMEGALRSAAGSRAERAPTLNPAPRAHAHADMGSESYTVPLSNVKASAFAKVVEYCMQHSGPGAEARKAGMAAWDKKFVDAMEQPELFDLIIAANFLDMKPLLNSVLTRISDMIRGKTPEQIRKTLNIRNDFTKEEEDELRRENSWAFD